MAVVLPPEKKGSEVQFYVSKKHANNRVRYMYVYIYIYLYLHFFEKSKPNNNFFWSIQLQFW